MDPLSVGVIAVLVLGVVAAVISVLQHRKWSREVPPGDELYAMRYSVSSPADGGPATWQASLKLPGSGRQFGCGQADSDIEAVADATEWLTERFPSIEPPA